MIEPINICTLLALVLCTILLLCGFNGQLKGIFAALALYGGARALTLGRKKPVRRRR